VKTKVVFSRWVSERRLITKVLDDQRKIGHCFLVMKIDLKNKNITTEILENTSDVHVEVNEKGLIIVTSDNYPNHYVSLGVTVSGVELILTNEEDRTETVIYRTTNQLVKDILSEDYYVYTTENSVIVIKSDDVPDYDILFGIDDGGHISLDIFTSEGVETNVGQI